MFQFDIFYPDWYTAIQLVKNSYLVRVFMKIKSVALLILCSTKLLYAGQCVSWKEWLWNLPYNTKEYILDFHTHNIVRLTRIPGLCFALEKTYNTYQAIRPNPWVRIGTGTYMHKDHAKTTQCHQDWIEQDQAKWAALKENAKDTSKNFDRNIEELRAEHKADL